MLTLFALEQNTLKTYEFLDKNDVKLALMHVYNINSYTEYIIKLHSPITEKKEFSKIIKRLINGEPIQYILGEVYFYDRYFIVNKNVLIPRVETEELVDLVLKDLDGKSGNLLDLGTGSGAIAIILKAHSKLNVYGSDISKKALKVARQNDIDKGVKFIPGDLLLPFIKAQIPLDYIVANLPYIKEHEIVDTKVRYYEPTRALYDTNAKMFPRLFKQVKKLNIPDTGLSIYLEVGNAQGNELRKLAQQHFGKNVKISVLNDMHGKERFVIIKDIYGNNNL